MTLKQRTTDSSSAEASHNAQKQQMQCRMPPATFVEGRVAWTSREEKSQRNVWLFINNLRLVGLKAQILSAKEEDTWQRVAD